MAKVLRFLDLAPTMPLDHNIWAKRSIVNE